MPIVEARLSSSGQRQLSRPALSEDIQRETALVPHSRTGMRYIYYRLYTKDGPLESYNPIYSNDRFLSRVSSRSLRPPHTVALLKNYICKFEGLALFESCTLYPSLSEPTPLEDSTHLSFRGTSGPGLSNLNPMALVVDTRAVEQRTQAASTAGQQELLDWDYEQRYVYYLLYDENGEVAPKSSFDENNPFLGRVNTLSIPPPQTVSSLKRYLMRFEEISGNNIQLFEDEDSESTMNDNDAIALLADTYPGFLEDEPVVITYESQGVETDDGPVDHNDSNEVQAQPTLFNQQMKVPSYMKQLTAKTSWYPRDQNWHRYEMGSAFYTDGISRIEKYYASDVVYYEWSCYLAMNTVGKVAFLLANYSTFYGLKVNE